MDGVPKLPMFCLANYKFGGFHDPTLLRFDNSLE